MRYCIAVFLASIHQTFQNHTHWSSFQKKKLHLEKHATHKHPICTTCCVAKDLYSPKIAVFLLLVSIQSIYCQKNIQFTVQLYNPYSTFSYTPQCLRQLQFVCRVMESYWQVLYRRQGMESEIHAFVWSVLHSDTTFEATAPEESKRETPNLDFELRKICRSLNHFRYLIQVAQL